MRDGNSVGPYEFLFARSRHTNPARLIPGGRSQDFSRPVSALSALSPQHIPRYFSVMSRCIGASSAINRVWYR
jgi:hypothetical protein